MGKNLLYFGDNLEILRSHIPSESIDLIYLDPPFNSKANYNVLFAEKSGEKSAAQITAFEDTWHWGLESEKSFHETVTEGSKGLSELLQSLRSVLSTNDMMAYLTMMAPRIAELHRILKPTGTIYLHCDTTASHYIKLLMDAVFGPKRFLNEVSWRRSSAHSDVKQGMRRYGKIRDVLLVYTKSTEYTWNSIYTPYSKDYLESEYRHVTPDDRRYKETDLTAAKPGGDVEYNWYVKRKMGKSARWEPDLNEEYKTPKQSYEYRSVRPYHGRFWAYSKSNLIQFAKEGKLIHRETGMPRLMQFADEMPGIPLQDLWDDIPPASGGQDLGYPTQKPEALLERIIEVSSNKGDLILDPFCGCGTAIAVAERLHRRWIGIDITHLAMALMRHRLHSTFRSELSDYEVIGDPKDLASAEALAQEDRYQFEWWALFLIDAMPAHDKRKGADSGIDGYINFFDDSSGKAKKIIVQVKSGHVSSSQIRDLKGVLEREKAAIGAFITLKNPTRDMIKEAVSAGFYEAKHYAGREYPRVQILTIEELLSGKKLLYPLLKEVTFRQAERKSKTRDKQAKLF